MGRKKDEQRTEPNLERWVQNNFLKERIKIFERSLEQETKMRLLVTGGCGFIGSNVVNHFVRDKGWFVVNVDRIDYCGDPKHIDEDIREGSLSHLYSHEWRDANDENGMLALLRKYNIDTVVHFAAQSHVDRSFENPKQFLRDNVETTISLLSAARTYRETGGALVKFVHVSTDEVYGEQRDRQKVSEDAQFHPSNPYSASKAAAEHFVEAFATSFKLPTIITRANNVYGPNQHEEKVTPRFIKLLQSGTSFTVHGNGEQTRSFLHASDAARAFSLIVEKGHIGEAYNIESERDYSIRELADTLVKVSGLPHPGFINAGDRPFNDLCYLVDGSKLKEHTGWQQTVMFEEGLRMFFQ